MEMFSTRSFRVNTANLLRTVTSMNICQWPLTICQWQYCKFWCNTKFIINQNVFNGPARFRNFEATLSEGKHEKAFVHAGINDILYDCKSTKREEFYGKLRNIFELRIHGIFTFSLVYIFNLLNNQILKLYNDQNIYYTNYINNVIRDNIFTSNLIKFLSVII